MSSGEDDINDGEHINGQESKKRRIQRACDTCRRKKSDGGQVPSNRCSNCSAYNLDCTYVEAAKKRGPPKGYVESLENRLENMEKLLQRLCPDADFTQELGARIDRDNWPNDKRSLDSVMPSRGSRQSSPGHRLSATTLPSAGGHPLPLDPDDLAPSDDDLTHGTLTEGLKRLAMDPLDRHFHGKSSGVMLVQAAMNLKQEFSGTSTPPDNRFPARRSEIWSPHPWEVLSEEKVVQYHYPPDDLMPELVDSYFANLNLFFPLLHRPSFERALADRRHHTDIGYGSVVLLVCALGARWSDDPRCLLEGMSKHSSGWKWFDQVQVHRKSFVGAPRLYDLQIYALSSFFLQSSSSPQSSWTMVGIGIRLAEDVGAHRRKVYNAPLSVESELWKRAFWVLVALDRFGSAALGRPCAIQDEDFDLDLPLEVDDEYWEHPDPAKAFKQPTGIPCSTSFFNSFLKLNQILAFALRTIYSINKSKILLGFVGPQWEQHIVAELDSALNKWIDTVPDHLRWDPHRENPLHFKQSATLYATYYHLQILIHRPFIPSPRKPSPLTFPSLAICTNAARSCSHVADICRRRECLPLPQIHIASFTAGIVLLLNIWGAKKSGTFVDSGNQMADVRKCMQVLRATEERYISAGRLWDVLNELACAGDIPVDKGTPPSNKRERESDSPISNGSSPALSQMVPPIIPESARAIAGRRSFGSLPGHPTSQPKALPVVSTSTAGSNRATYNTEQLAHTKNNMVGGPGNVPLSWMPAHTSQHGAPMPHGAGAGNPAGFGDQTSVFSQNAMPNLNIFDLFQSDPQMFNMPMMGQNFTPGMPPAGPGMHAEKVGPYGQPISGPPGNIQEGYGQPDGPMPPVNEALQMWSSAPTSFE
ncbi:hypothetical protein M0805_001580 [Coniferiporia weirii]|nr:hypothetical protein M0805_001580 [Coniferiporia weirii]